MTERKGEKICMRWQMGRLWRFSIEEASTLIESIFIIFLSIYNRIAFIQNTCLYTCASERTNKIGTKCNMMYKVGTKVWG
jgi:hypothetical protein